MAALRDCCGESEIVCFESVLLKACRFGWSRAAGFHEGTASRAREPLPWEGVSTKFVWLERHKRMQVKVRPGSQKLGFGLPVANWWGGVLPERVGGRGSLPLAAMLQTTRAEHGRSRWQDQGSVASIDVVVDDGDGYLVEQLVGGRRPASDHARGGDKEALSRCGRVGGEVK